MSLSEFKEGSIRGNVKSFENINRPIPPPVRNISNNVWSCDPKEIRPMSDQEIEKLHRTLEQIFNIKIKEGN